MRPCVLAASMSLVLILSGRVVVQTIQNRPPDHDHPAVGFPGVRQLAVKPFTTLPKGVLFLRLENFSTTKAAEDAATSASAVVGVGRKDLVVHAWPNGRTVFRWHARRGDWTGSRCSARGKLRAGRRRSRFRPRDEGSSCAASPYAPGSRDLLPSYRRTVPRNSERNDTSASRRRHGRSCTYADATQHHGFIEARCFLRRRSRCYETADGSFGLATNG